MKIWAILLLTLLGSGAVAQQQSAQSFPKAFPTGQLPPKTIWQIADNQTALNLQSRLECPTDAGEFHRISLIIYNAFGTDVSCGYHSINGGTITFYIALRGNQQTADQEFEAGKKSILQRVPNTTPLADAEQQTFMSDLDWRHIIYRANGVTREGIWMTRLGGWNVEFRVTYPQSGTDAVFAAMSALSANAQKTAGEHIAACFAMTRVVRNGQLILNPQMAQVLSVTGILTVQTSASTGPNWCVQQELTINGAQWLLWRNAGDQNGGAADRLTSMADENAPVIYSVADSHWQPGWKLAERPTAPYEIAIETPAEIALAGVFEGRPTIQQLANVTRPTVPLYARLDKNTKQLSLYRPPLPPGTGTPPPPPSAPP